MIRIEGRPNRLGMRGWAVGGRWGLERYLYTLHRVTGLALLAYFLLHIFVTSSRASAIFFLRIGERTELVTTPTCAWCRGWPPRGTSPETAGS